MADTGKYKTSLATVLLAVSYAFLSIYYFIFIDPKCYFKNIFNNDIMLAMPAIYILLTALFACLYSYFSKTDIKRMAYPVAAMAIAFSLSYLLADMKAGMLKTNPFAGNRNVYGIYAFFHCLVSLSAFFLLSGGVLRKLMTGEITVIGEDHDRARNAVFHIPLITCLLLIEAIFFVNGLMAQALIFAALFAVSLSSGSISPILRRCKEMMAWFFGNEKLFLIFLFSISFLIRWFWGERVLALTGANFIRASDDGITYDRFASMLSQGQKISKSDAFYWSGFGYWYFLSAIYRLFGQHNFSAVIIIQSALSATVPVFTYIVGKRIFGSTTVCVLASLLTAFNLTLIFLSAVIGMEAIYIPLFMMAVTVAAHYLTGSALDWKKAFSIGAAFGLANNARSEVLFFPILIAMLIVMFLGRRRDWTKTVLIAVSVLIGFVMLMSIQHITNYCIYKEYRLTSGALDVTYTIDLCTNENTILNKMGFNPFTSVSRSLSAFASQPCGVSKLLVKGFIKRWIIYFFKPNFGVFDPIYLVNPASGYFFRFPVWVQLYEYIFVLVGLFLALRNRKNLLMKILLIAFSIYLSSMYAFVWVTNSRHRAVLIPIFAVFFAYGLYEFAKRVKAAYVKK